MAREFYDDKKLTAVEAVEMMWQAAMCGLCHCNNNPSGIFPCDCDCEVTEKYSESITMLLEVKNDILKNL